MTTPTAITVRFTGTLNDFLPYARREAPFTLRVDGHPSVKDVVESAGVPHTEVGALLVNGAVVDFSYTVREGDEISAFPVGAAPPGVGSLQPPAPQPPRFLLDVHLGRLASYLRLLGFDTLYENVADDPDLAAKSRDEGRVLLTRDVGLLKRSVVRHGYFVRATSPAQQAEEVVRRYGLSGAIAPFSRCLRCNGPLTTVEKAEIEEQLPPRVREQYELFHRCAACDHVYWQGTHYQHMRQLVERLRRDDN